MPDPMTIARFVFRFMVKLCSAFGYAALVAPWILFSIAGAGLRRLDAAAKLVLVFPRATATDIRCPRGHRSETRGTWECRGCGGLFAGWAFQACPVCGASCGHISCEHCGLSIRNPFV